MQVERNVSVASPRSKPHPTGRDLLSTSFSTQLLGFFISKSTQRADDRDFFKKSSDVDVTSVRDIVSPENQQKPSRQRSLSASLSSPAVNVTAAPDLITIPTHHLTCPAPAAMFALHASKPTTELPRHEDKSWRCDLHPAWGRDFQYVTINGRPYGAERQVFVVHVGDDLGRFFPPL